MLGQLTPVQHDIADLLGKITVQVIYTNSEPCNLSCSSGQPVCVAKNVRHYMQTLLWDYFYTGHAYTTDTIDHIQWHWPWLWVTRLEGTEEAKPVAFITGTPINWSGWSLMWCWSCLNMLIQTFNPLTPKTIVDFPKKTTKLTKKR